MTKEHWWHDDPKYKMSFGELIEYAVKWWVETEPTTSWLQEVNRGPNLYSNSCWECLMFKLNWHHTMQKIKQETITKHERSFFWHIFLRLDGPVHDKLCKWIRQ